MSSSTNTFPPKSGFQETGHATSVTRSRPLVPGLPNRVVDAAGIVKRSAASPTTDTQTSPNWGRQNPPTANNISGRVVIGDGIRFKGDFGTCQMLIVGGLVDGNLSDGDIEILETGRFKGTATVRNATVHGNFEGTLTVRGTLVLTSQAHVRGTIRYHTLNIETGGRIGGDIDELENRHHPMAKEHVDQV